MKRVMDSNIVIENYIVNDDELIKISPKVISLSKDLIELSKYNLEEE